MKDVMFKSVLLKSILILPFLLAAQEVPRGSLSDIRKMGSELHNVLNQVANQYAGLLSSEQLGLLTDMMKELEQLSLPQKQELVYGDYEYSQWRCSPGNKYEILSIIRRSIANGIASCISNGEFDCNFEKFNFIDEDDCEGRAYLSTNKAPTFLLSILTKVASGLAKLSSIYELMSAEERQSYGKFRLKLEMFLRNKNSKSNIPTFHGKAGDSQYACNPNEPFNRLKFLRLAQTEATRKCNDAGYLKCEPISVWAENYDMGYPEPFKKGLIADEEDCEAHMWVQPVAE